MDRTGPASYLPEVLSGARIVPEPIADEEKGKAGRKPE